jgi:hypothetical protein
MRNGHNQKVGWIAIGLWQKTPCTCEEDFVLRDLTYTLVEISSVAPTPLQLGKQQLAQGMENSSLPMG